MTKSCCASQEPESGLSRKFNKFSARVKMGIACAAGGTVIGAALGDDKAPLIGAILGGIFGLYAGGKSYDKKDGARKQQTDPPPGCRCSPGR